MRDIARIPRILKLIYKYWIKHPDYRFGQLMYNIMMRMPEVVQVSRDCKVGIDPFYLEDDKFEEYLRILVEE